MQSDRWFSHSLRVRYQETDQMGVVYHANYLNWFEIARTELIRELGMPYRIIEPQGLLLPVIDVEMKFMQPARYDDVVRIHTCVTNFSHVRIQFKYEIRRSMNGQEENFAMSEREEKERSGDLLVGGTTRHVWINAEWKPVRIDKEFPDLFQLIRDNLK